MDGEPGYTLLERLSARPTFDINGVWGGYQGEGSKTIIPAFAAAKLSTRLVPDQDHREIEELMVKHLERIAPPTVRGQRQGDPRRPAGDHAARPSGRDHRRRGSAPGLWQGPRLSTAPAGRFRWSPRMDTALDLKTVMVGFASPNGNFHAPNEWMPLGNLPRRAWMPSSGSGG